MKNRFLAMLVLVTAIFFSSIAVCAEKADPVKKLRNKHPRLLLDDAGLADLKATMKTDARLQQYRDKLLKLADAALDEPLPVYEKPDGFRLLKVSRTVIKRVTALSLAWRLTGEEKYATRAKADLLAVAAFPDWNPIHFLDTAEMAAAVGIGLDWLWPILTEEERATLRQAIQRHALVPYLSTHTATRYGGGVEGVGWVDKDNNWVAVCNGGVLIASLAAAEPDDLVSMNQLRAVLAATRAQLPNTLKTYEPDGGYPEGVMYWTYGSYYLAMALASLESAMGDDFGLAENPGLAKTGAYVLHAHDPQGWNLNYADAKLSRKCGNQSTARLFFSKRFNLPLLADLHHMQMGLDVNADRVTAWDLIWYTPGGGESELPREAYFAGQTPLAVWRSAWNDPRALYVGIIGGTNPGPHGHLDLGNFELRSLGQRWVVDIGKDDYGLPAYWDRKAGGKRWHYFALGTQGHNVPMIAGKQQRIPARADFTHFGAGETPGAIIDLSEAYAPAKVHRGLRLLEDRAVVLVQDEFKNAEGTILWGLTINAEAEVKIEKNTATLSLDGESLKITCLKPADITFTVHDVQPKETANKKMPKGGKRLAFEIENPAAETTVAVVFAPVASNTATTLQIQPLAEWSDLEPVEAGAASTH